MAVRRFTLAAVAAKESIRSRLARKPEEDWRKVGE
jgi:hypothetical protein